MAKSKNNPIPVIPPPNSGLQSWLNEQNQTANTPATIEEAPRLDVTPDLTAASDQIEQPVNNTSSTDDSGKEVAVHPGSQPVNQEAEEVIKGKENSNLPNEAVTAPVSRKSKSRGGEGERSGSYPETFFKKPVKTADDTSSSEVKPVRISEESHWLLSVLVSEARRKGHKLNVGDLVDNLLANHRSVYKDEVNELIAGWKSRKRFE